MNERDYSVPLQSALTSFQFIEEGLKMYLATAYSVAQKRCGADVPINLDLLMKLNRKKTLGSLITLFSCFTNNQDLVKELNTLSAKRNFCAHQAFLLTYEEQKDHEFLREHTKELIAIADAAHDAFMRLLAEVKSLSEKQK